VEWFLVRVRTGFKNLESHGPKVTKVGFKNLTLQSYCGDDRASVTLVCLKRRTAWLEEAAERDSWIPGFVPESGATATIQ
jgi:hypothetical protein